MIELQSAGFDDRDPLWRKPLSQTTTHAIALIVSGKLIYRINGKVLHVKRGDLLYIPADCLREGFRDHNEDHQKYWATFTHSPAAPEAFPMLGQSAPCLVPTRHYEYMKQRFSLLVQQWMGKLPYYEGISSAIAAELVGHMNRELDTRQHPSPKVDLITDIQQYILAHYREDIRVDRLAELVERTPNYISALFRQLTGMTVKEYVHQVKLSAARDLLLNTGITIGEAAEYVGFCDQSYFNRIFKKVHGFPPSALLKERSQPDSIGVEEGERQ